MFDVKILFGYIIGLLLSIEFCMDTYMKRVNYRDNILKKIFLFVAIFTIVPLVVGAVLLALLIW